MTLLLPRQTNHHYVQTQCPDGGDLVVVPIVLGEPQNHVSLREWGGGREAGGSRFSLKVYFYIYKVVSGLVLVLVLVLVCGGA